MSDTKTVFGKDGSYTRVNEVEELDVSAPSEGKAQKPATSPEEKTTSSARKKVKSKQNTFNLGALRAAAHKASSSVTSTKLPEPGSPEFSSVETKSVPSGAAKSQPGSTAKKTTKKVEAPSVEPDPVSNVNSVPADTIVSAQEPTPQAVESVPQPAVSKSTDEGVDAGSDNSTTEVAPIELEAVSHKVEANVETPSTSAPEVVTPAESTVEGFKIISLEKILEHLGWVDLDRLTRWLVSCVKASASYPGLVLEHSTNSDLRFYNYIYDASGSDLVVAVGVVQELTVLSLNIKKRTVSDVGSRAVSSAEMVTVDGVPLVLYEERLHKTRKV